MAQNLYSWRLYGLSISIFDFNDHDNRVAIIFSAQYSKICREITREIIRKDVCDLEIILSINFKN